MKILVVNNMVPFMRGGAERLAENLVRNLRRYGHDADLLRIPFRWDPCERLYDEILACRMMKLYNVDRVIGLKFPAYLIPHPNKTLWLVHQYRQAYDLVGTEHTNLPDNAEGSELRRCISAADNECFAQSDKLFSISQVVQKRLNLFNQFDCDVLHPPLDDADSFRPEAVENYIFSGGRINACKRQHLLVEAMAHVARNGAGNGVKLIIAGPPDSPRDGERLAQLVKRHKLEDRVELHFGFQPREKLVRWVNRSLACACVPFDEDYGYVTLEAFYAGKPVIATTDAGGVLDFVTDRQTGRVAEPNAQSLAQSIQEVAEDRATTVAWGEAAKQHIHERNINWPETVKKLAA